VEVLKDYEARMESAREDNGGSNNPARILKQKWILY